MRVNKSILRKSQFTDKEINHVLTFALDKFHRDRLNGKGFTTPAIRRVYFFFIYLSNFGNATRAAVEAGYSPKSAKQQGYRNLKWIQARIAEEERTIY